MGGLKEEIQKAKHLMGLCETKAKSHEYIKLIDTPNLLIIIPLSRDAACKYGSNTKYCVSAIGNYFFYGSDTIYVFFIQYKTDSNGKRGIRSHYEVFEYGPNTMLWWNENNKWKKTKYYNYPENTVRGVVNFVRINYEDLIRQKNSNLNAVDRLRQFGPLKPEDIKLDDVDYNLLKLLHQNSKSLHPEYVSTIERLTIVNPENQIGANISKLFPNLRKIKKLRLYSDLNSNEIVKTYNIPIDVVEQIERFGFNDNDHVPLEIT